MIHDQVRSGLYNNQSEFVREALRLMAEQERLREALFIRSRSALAGGLSEANRGEFFDGPEVVDPLREFLRERRGPCDRSE